MTVNAISNNFHGYLDTIIKTKPAAVVTNRPILLNHHDLIIQERELRYQFYPHFHPYVGQLVQRLLKKSVSGLQAADTEYVTNANGSFVTLPNGKKKPVHYADIFSQSSYKPSATLVRQPYPVKELDFTATGAYSAYNWELFFHVPLTIAIHLSKNQRFADAQRWFHFLFDPTDDSEGPTPQRFWKVRPFQHTDVEKMEEILVNLSTGADPKLRNETIRSIEAWKNAPFRPHVVARYRQQAYMYKTVMAYLDNLIAWGDSLFRQDTGETIDEAMMLYVLAANILGPRPLPVPEKGSVRPQTYANLRNDLDRFGNALRSLETNVGFDLAPFPDQDDANDERLTTLSSLGKALYFCVPRNDKLLSYWDTVADRLFKIRNSLNLQGIFRQLALFEPPIDPAMLARATAAGLDVSAVVNGVNQPLPLVRFSLLVQKAAEICQEVKSLGSNLLAAMEKEDGEALAILRARHERVVMEMVEHVRYAQVQEAIKSREGLLKSLALAVQRYTYYERQLGRKPEEIEKSIPQLAELDQESLDKMKFNMKEPEVLPREIKVDIATDVFSQAAQVLNGGKILSSHEVRESLLLEGAQLTSDLANILHFAASIPHFVPQFHTNLMPMGVGATVEYGGQNVGDAITATAAAASAVAERLNFEARRAGRIDSFARREQEWAFQSNLAAGEITQIFKQLRAAEIREAITEFELKNHRQQMKHAEEIESFLNEEGAEKNGKKTNKSLYTWMKREVRGLYGQCFQFAFDVARKAERALQHELGNSELNYLHFGYLAGKEGLLAGEKLYLDIKRMEMAYHDLNQREYELTKHISLMQVDPLALIDLRATGRCVVKLPEELFDLDAPGHYFRRIKTVALSIPCVAGPYASVNCTLTLLKSSIRTTPVLRGQYRPEDAEDDRFSTYFGSMQSIVTSSGQNDSGLFETNLRDERYLPFENSGVVSEWQLELPADPSKSGPAPQFDYDTIADVILHMRYTAREGGGPLRQKALENVDTLMADPGSKRLFSVRHEFPTEWARFLAQTPATPQRFELKLNLKPEHYPFWSQGHLNTLMSLDLWARISSSPVLVPMEALDPSPTTTQGEWKLFLATNALEELWIVVGYGGDDDD
jgi:receptor-binding and translocation channel-forming TcA subunit of Tc toxin